MKKILIILVILVIGFSAFALDFSINFGVKNETVNAHIHDPFYISIDVLQDFDNLQIYANYTNEISNKTELLMFCPPKDYVIVGMVYDFGGCSLISEYKYFVPIEYRKRYNNNYVKIEIQIGSNK